MSFKAGSETCLLLIDVQKDFWSANPGTIQQNFSDFPKKVAELLELCRQKRIEIIHVRAVYNDGVSKWLPEWRRHNPDKKADVAETPEPFATEQHGETVIHKPAFDGFLQTNLEDVLQSRQIKQVIVAGLITSCCVLFTAAGAYMRGYKVLIADECCADRSRLIHDNMINRYAQGYMFKCISLEDIKIVL